MMVKLLDLKKQILDIRPEIDDAIKIVIDSASYIGGSHVREFERSFSNYIGVNESIGVGNGTDALEIALATLSLPKGSLVGLPANSFIASAEAITRSGHTPIFIDVDQNSFNIDLNDLKRVLKKLKALIVVHLYGMPADIVKIQALCNEHDIKLIEDCAQAHGASVNGTKVGSFGDISAFSFYPGKNLGAFGDGGAVCTSNEDYGYKARLIANHGRIEKYNHLMEGRNSRLDSIQAAVLSVKLRHLDDWLLLRERQASLYDELLAPKIQKKINCRSSNHLYVIKSEKREGLRSYLEAQGIETGIHYPMSLNKYPFYKDYEGRCPVAEILATQVLSLPIGEHLKDDDIKFVANKICEFNKKL